MSKVDETRFIVQHESYECKCRLNGNVYNLKQKCNHDKCRCECNESIHWSWILGHVIAAVIKRVKSIRT